MPSRTPSRAASNAGGGKSRRASAAPSKAASEVSESVSVHPEDLITGQLSPADAEEHIYFLLEKVGSDDRQRRRKGAEALSLYIADGRVDPTTLEVHPADVLGEEVTMPRADKVTIMGSLAAICMMGPHAADCASDACGFLLKHAESEVRFEAARALEAMGPGAAEGAAKELGEALVEEEERNIRYMVSKALFNMGPEGAKNGAARYVAQGLQDEDTMIQLMCGHTLQAMGPDAAPEAAQALVDVLEHADQDGGNFELKRIAVDALAAMGEVAAEVAALPLAKVLRVGPKQLPVPASSDVYLREHAARAIGGMGTEAIKGQQVRLARAIGAPVGASGRGDRDFNVQQAVAETLDAAGAELETARKGSMAFFVDKGPFEEKKEEKKRTYSTKVFDDLFGEEIAEDEAEEVRKQKEQEKKARSKSRSTSRAADKKGRKK